MDKNWWSGFITCWVWMIIISIHMCVEWNTTMLCVISISLVINSYHDWVLKWIHDYTIMSQTFEQQGKFFSVAQSGLESQLLLKCFN